MFQVKSWIHEKTQVATDDSYRDPVNLQSKIMKHQTFEAELVANKRRVDAVNTVSNYLSFVFNIIYVCHIMAS